MIFKLPTFLSIFIFLLLSVSAFGETPDTGCQFNTELFIKKLEKKYQKDLIEFQQAKQYVVNKISCKEIPKTNKAIITLFYNTKIVFNDVLHSLLIAIVDKSSNIILQDFYHHNIIKNNVKQYKVGIDVSTYAHLSDKKPFSITLSYETNYHLKRTLFIYEATENTLRLLLNGAELDRDDGYKESEQSELHYALKSINTKEKNSYSPLVFNRSYQYSYLDTRTMAIKKWSKTLEPTKYVYDKSFYVLKQDSPVFSLQKIELQAKEGKRFQIDQIKAITFEKTPVFTEYNDRYNRITHYLNQSGQYKQAIIILKQMLEQQNEKPEAHLRLADAYWGLGKKYKARLHYSIYINQSKAKGETPIEIATQRASKKSRTFTKNFENSFQQVHPKIQAVSPLLFRNKGDTKPIAVLPWLQKKLLSVSNGKLLKVFAYKKNQVLTFLYFLKTQDKSGQYKIGLYQFSENEKSHLITTINIDTQVASFLATQNNNHTFQNYQLKNDTLTFFILTDELGENAEEYGKKYYEFSLKKQKVKLLYSDREEKPYLSFRSHNDTTLVTKEDNGETNSITYTDLGKSLKYELFKIQNFEGNFVIGDINWSKDNKWIYFDNHGEVLACIWRYNIETKELSKIVPEHEAEHPYSFDYKGVPHIIYVEGQNIMLARPKY